MRAPASDSIDWKKSGGLVPAIVQDATTGRVLMLGYMNRDAYERTLSVGEAVFFSRSRERLWRKGETSGNTLKVTEIRADCDGDTLLVRAEPSGPTCHRGTVTCFGEELSATLLDDLEAVIDGRLAQRPEESYVAKLAAAGVTRAAQKVGEEGVETALAAVTRDDDGLAEESADLVFHLLVLLRIRGLSLEDLMVKLAARRR
ncbi:bifunctional phosphoribosyl-AMP cyclohydrolase/phosphoribosyl-ATP diphosphatase HisIE [Thioalkalivibrio sp. XN279]|uniref:bifunctional phosphoribosyl-AMP cyclohydrolase/phosphoribosyl-ATP diphosphatase HisIE n=1 Tax=Thioalkalivibrio sp. XN279 TaxID=2714953 RepID=UPI0014073B8B|nr:bifunctional phosphoribosyl-AMP cyclohydrolase/phosphoribosyl-ATP diphosphatase HisIE [Thioalkalivibrio sp. XN279]NHA14913.1 bifunctional phosphoribosyl-AMP cyclohydrolase/phosphoribosyl-ATP diphosphatase HisIE [Thioalkalivibrio sp. XN279]